MKAEETIKHVVEKKKRKADGTKVTRIFNIYHDGTSATVKEMVEVTNDSTGEKVTQEHWRERQDLVRAGILKNQDFEAAYYIWRDEYKMRDILLRKADSKCNICDGPNEIWRHEFDNDAAQKRETYLYKKCTDCNRKEAINRSDKHIPYDELPKEEPKEEKEE